MKKSSYLKHLQESYDSGRIDAEAYDAAYAMMDLFCE